MAKATWKTGAMALALIVAVWGSVGYCDTAAQVVGDFSGGYPIANPTGTEHRLAILRRCTDMTITHLGILDYGDPELMGSHQLGLWRVNLEGGVTLLASGSMTGSIGTLEDGYRFIEIDPITLPANDVQRYLIGVWTESSGTPGDGLIVRPPSAVQTTGDITIQAQLARFTETFDFPWTNVSEYDHFCVNFKYRLPGPAADAGPDMTIASADQISDDPVDRTILGTTTDATQYRWLEGAAVLLDYSDVGATGEAPLDMNDLEPLFFPTDQVSAQYVLTLEATDGTTTATDDMTLTVLNTAPDEAALASQVVKLDLDPIIVTASVSDFDGDTLSYEWFIDGQTLGAGTIEAFQGGEQADIPDLVILPGDADYDLFVLGTNTVELHVSDPTGTVVTSVAVDLVDTTAPTLAPVAWPRILWPPDGRLKDVTIWANAFDNGGGPITLDVTVTGLNVDSDDYTIVSVDNETGVIDLQLRSSTQRRHSPAKIYKVTITATDESGNESTARVRILAPRRGWRWRCWCR